MAKGIREVRVYSLMDGCTQYHHCSRGYMQGGSGKPGCKDNLSNMDDLEYKVKESEQMKMLSEGP